MRVFLGKKTRKRFFPGSPGEELEAGWAQRPSAGGPELLLEAQAKPG